MDLWTLVRFLHLLAMAFFVGGQLFLVVAVVPAVRRGGGEALMAPVARRFGYGSLVAIVVLAATGSAMASHFGRWGDPTLHVKLALVALVGAAVAFHVGAPRNRALSAGIFLLSVAVAWLGVALAH